MKIHFQTTLLIINHLKSRLKQVFQIFLTRTAKFGLNSTYIQPLHKNPHDFSILKFNAKLLDDGTMFSDQTLRTISHCERTSKYENQQ